MVGVGVGTVEGPEGGAALEGMGGGGEDEMGWRREEWGDIGHHDGHVGRCLERDPAVAVLVVHLPCRHEQTAAQI